jgi:hypothetical protein
VRTLAPGASAGEYGVSLREGDIFEMTYYYKGNSLNKDFSPEVVKTSSAFSCLEK